MKKILLFFFSINMVSLYGINYYNASKDLVFEASKEFKMRSGMSPSMDGGAFGTEVFDISHGFSGKFKMNQDQIRVFFIEFIEIMKRKFNDNIPIRVYLHEYPITTKSMNLELSMFNETHEDFVEKPYIASVFHEDDTIYYRVFSKKDDRFVVCNKESYAEALRIVRESGETIESIRVQVDPAFRAKLQKNKSK